MAWASGCVLLALVVVAAARGNATDNATAPIVGGRPVEIVDYPFMVSLQVNDVHVCAATILTPLWILTVAHCFLNVETLDPVNRSALAVLAGTSVADTEAAMADMDITHSLQYRAIARVITHFEEKLHLDVAIAAVHTPFRWTKWVQPVKLWEGAPPPPGTRCVVLGWNHALQLNSSVQGAERPRPKTPANTMILKSLVLPLISTTACKEYYPHVMDDAHLCTMAEGRDDCNGDPGGPLVCEKREVALVQGDGDCSQKGVPRVYTLVEPVFAIRKWAFVAPKKPAPETTSYVTMKPYDPARNPNAARRLHCCPAMALLLPFLLLSAAVSC